MDALASVRQSTIRNSLSQTYSPELLDAFKAGNEGWSGSVVRRAWRTETRARRGTIAWGAIEQPPHHSRPDIKRSKSQSIQLNPIKG